MSEATFSIGLKGLHYALLIKDDVTGVSYGVPKPLINAIEAKVTPSVTTGTLYADDGAAAVATNIGETAVELNVGDIPYEISAELLGQKMNTDGVLKDNASDQAPYVALGYIRTTTGKDRFTWLLKGKFSIPEENSKTKGDKVEFQTSTIKGTFVKRVFDGDWRYQIDSSTAIADPAVVTAWFEEVYAEIPKP